MRCELSYRRCTVSVAEMMDMVETEVAELEMIEKEVSKGVVSVEDIENRYIIVHSFSRRENGTLANVQA